MLATTSLPLCDVYDVAMFDLDGVLYIGGAAVAGAPAHVAAAVAAGMRPAYITNNASRPAATVAEHLRELGYSARRADVVTSAQAAAEVLLERYGRGARIAVLGGPGLVAAISEADLLPVNVGDAASAVATGYGPDVLWRDIMRTAVLIRDGLPWVASNADSTIPSADGIAPGHGVLVETLARFTGVQPTIAGKPERPLLEETIRRMNASHPLMVGDRLDTDIEGANNIGIDSLLVLTGVTGLKELVAAPEQARPTYIAPDLGGLVSVHRAPTSEDESCSLGGWSGSVEDRRLVVSGSGPAADWWRVVASVGWRYLDRHGDTVDVTGLPPSGPGER